MGDIAKADSATVQNGLSITRLQSAAAASINVDKHFGQRALGPPTSESVGDLCIWTGIIDFDDGETSFAYSLVRLVSMDGESASVRSLTATNGAYVGKTKDFVE